MNDPTPIHIMDYVDSVSYEKKFVGRCVVGESLGEGERGGYDQDIYDIIYMHEFFKEYKKNSSEYTHYDSMPLLLQKSLHIYSPHHSFIPPH